MFPYLVTYNNYTRTSDLHDFADVSFIAIWSDDCIAHIIICITNSI